MKIGILTFHRAHNYGAILQCYALQEYLKQEGHHVEVLDYCPQFVSDTYAVWKYWRFIARNPFVMLKKIWNELLIFPHRVIRHYSFNKFIEKELNLSLKVRNLLIPSSYDIYVIGSDQVWNSKITKGFDKIYFGYWGFNKGSKRIISYAASMEATTLSRESEIFFEKALENFDAISVRESKMQELLQPLTKKKINIVLDPTLLVNNSIWHKIAEMPRCKRKYVLVYQVQQDENSLRIAHSIAKQIDAEVFEIVAWLQSPFKRNVIQCASPKDFLGWIKYASCIITTSFHGTAFSIIFNKPFYCLELGMGWDNRSLFLLENTGLKNRMIDKKCSPSFQDINYDIVNKRLVDMREDSIKYISASTNI